MIQVNRLSIRKNEKMILNEISFGLAQGRVLGIYGPNGSGKSTLLKSISSQRREFESTGEIEFNGKRLETLATIAEQVKTALYIGSDFRAPFDLTVRDLFEMSAMVGSQSLWPTPSAQDQIKIAKVVNELSLHSFLPRVFRSLSDGEKQWMMFARALIQGADVLLFDESFSKLDLDRLVETARIIRNRAKAGQTFVVCAHDLNFISEIADEVLLLKNGRVIKHGSIHDVFSKEVFSTVYPNLGLSFLQSEQSGRPKVIY